jgi:hypothetical protein
VQALLAVERGGVAEVRITFNGYLPVAETMCFEEVFEESLQLDKEEKAKILEKGFPVWMRVDGELAGESYGIALRDLKEKIEDCENESPSTVYCYSTALLPKFRSKGLGPILKAYWLGMVKGNGVQRVVAHATSEQAKKLNEMFGACFDYGSQHEKWYGTERTAIFYWINL